MEAIVVKAVVRELERELPARVQAVLQPSTRGIVLSLRGAGTLHLLLSAEPEAPRLHLIEGRPPGLPVPTAFCRLLRKQLEGLVLRGVESPGVERIVRLEFARSSGAPGALLLVAELMGKHSNLILLDVASGCVVDSLQHVAPPMSRVRTVLPGLPYTEPPTAGRLDLDTLDAASFAAVYREVQGKPAGLLRRLLGLSPGLLLLGEAHARLDLPGAADPALALFSALAQCRARVERGDLSPSGYPEKKLLLPLAVPGWEPPAGGTAPTMNRAAELYYAELLSRRETERRRAEILRQVEREAKKAAAEEQLRAGEIRDGERAGLFQAAGTALVRAADTVPRGATSFPVEDPAGGGVRQIELDPALGPRQNAERLFRRARKIKRRAELARERLPRIIERRRLLDEEFALAATLPPAALAARVPPPSPPPARGMRRPKALPEIREYQSAAGWRILVGKSGAGNDYLTGRIAAPDDYWFHVRDYPGAHVVLKTGGAGGASAEAIRAAGEIAAWHSSARGEGMVDVGYTKRKHLRKAKGAAPGTVLIAESATVRVHPRIPAECTETKR